MTDPYRSEIGHEPFRPDGAAEESPVRHLFEQILTGECGPDDLELIGRVREVVERKMRRAEMSVDQATVNARVAHIQTALDMVNSARGWRLTMENYKTIRLIAAQSPASIADPKDAPLAHAISTIIVAEVEAAAQRLVVEAAETRYGVADMAALVDAVEIVRLEDRANKREVTGLLGNREAIRDRFNILRREFLETAEADEVILVIELDIVKFKSLNDRFGNGEVDRHILRPLGERLRSGIRRESGQIAKLRVDDIVANIGGDEFQFIIRTRKSAADAMIRMIQSTIESEPFRVPMDGGEQLVELKTRAGAEMLERETLAAIDTTDASAWFDGELRRHPLEAVENVKTTTDTGFGYWLPGTELSQSVAMAVEIDSFTRALSARLAEIATSLGQAEADELERGLVKLYRNTLIKKYASTAV